MVAITVKELVLLLIPRCSYVRWYLVAPEVAHIWIPQGICMDSQVLLRLSWCVVALKVMNLGLLQKVFLQIPML